MCCVFCRNWLNKQETLFHFLLLLGGLLSVCTIVGVHPKLGYSSLSILWWGLCFSNHVFPVVSFKKCYIDLTSWVIILDTVFHNIHSMSELHSQPQTVYLDCGQSMDSKYPLLNYKAVFQFYPSIQPTNTKEYMQLLTHLHVSMVYSSFQQDKHWSRAIAITTILQYCTIDKQTAVDGKQPPQSHYVHIFSLFKWGAALLVLHFNACVLNVLRLREDPTLRSQLYV